MVSDIRLHFTPLSPISVSRDTRVGFKIGSVYGYCNVGQQIRPPFFVHQYTHDPTFADNFYCACHHIPLMGPAP